MREAFIDLSYRGLSVRERLRATGTAAATGAPIGHGKRNEAVPFGALAVLDLERATLAITEAAVA